MQYAGGVVKHLGLSMYRGAVPVLAELIANAWDADAARVDVSIPLDLPLDGAEIVVTDNGRGMTWSECDTQYLVVGRDRRAASGRGRTDSGRLVMGRKGLGKLAGFGIAEVVEVRTVREGWLTHFRMDFVQMTQGGEAALVRPYQPEILADTATTESNGTTVTLKRLILNRRIPGSEFQKSIARRFAVLGTQFQVYINGDLLPSEAMLLQFRFPEDGTNDEDVPGVGVVRWWVGFTQKPIKLEDARGISVIVRGKMAQTPFFFDLSGGVHGQHGMQYLTGEVVADQLDAADDYIATDRQALVWSEPVPAALLVWGQQKVRSLLTNWTNLRERENERELEQIVNELDDTVGERIDRLRPAEQTEARQVLRKLASIESITDDTDRAKELIDLVLRAFEDSSFFQLLRALTGTSQAERDQILKLVTELDIFETVKMAEVVRARVGVIRKFREMLANDVPEKPDMQDFLFGHPWLIDPQWQVVEHERGLETLLIEHYALDSSAGEESDKRIDFFCIGTRGRFLVVEVKRPSKTLGETEVVQIINYVTYLRSRAPGTQGRPNNYQGYLVGHHLSPDGVRWAATAEKDSVYVKTWHELLDTAERIHRDFLDAMTKRAPSDPRVQSLGPMDEPPTNEPPIVES